MLLTVREFSETMAKPVTHFDSLHSIIIRERSINRKPHINGLFHSLIIWYIMSSFQQTTTSHAKSQEKTLPEETKQASETDSDMTQLLERSEKASHALPRLIPLVIS